MTSVVPEHLERQSQRRRQQLRCAGPPLATPSREACRDLKGPSASVLK